VTLGMRQVDACHNVQRHATLFKGFGHNTGPCNRFQLEAALLHLCHAPPYSMLVVARVVSLTQALHCGKPLLTAGSLVLSWRMRLPGR
jgi:hypothetical protein